MQTRRGDFVLVLLAPLSVTPRLNEVAPITNR
jgi:hypothetical protein